MNRFIRVATFTSWLGSVTGRIMVRLLARIMSGRSLMRNKRRTFLNELPKKPRVTIGVLTDAGRYIANRSVI